MGRLLGAGLLKRVTVRLAEWVTEFEVGLLGWCVVNEETPMEELDRLLDLGEPLLAVFPKQLLDGWSFEVPDNVSPEMRRRAYSVALRERIVKGRECRCLAGAFRLARLAKRAEVGLLGWRAVGVVTWVRFVSVVAVSGCVPDAVRFGCVSGWLGSRLLFFLFR